ncbi:MAG TPA: glycosyltransferase [Candidatus Nanopelagicales bacterium]
MISERPFADGRRTAVFVFNELRADGGRLTQSWLWRLRAFEAAGWATHAALINKDAHLEATVDRLVADGRFPAATGVHHYAQRDRRVRPSWWGPLPPGQTLDDRIGEWLDWLTAQVPGAVVVADSPAAYPYVATMTNPTVAKLAAINLIHLAGTAPGSTLDPATAPLSGKFAERGFDRCQAAFDALAVMTHGQAADLRARFGADTPITVIPPAVPAPGTAPAARGGPRRIVAIGPFEAGSRHADAIRAFALVAAQHRDTILDLVGEGSLAAELRSIAFESGVGDRVRLVAPSPDPYQPLLGAALSLWTGTRSPMPLPVAHAVRAAVPVLAYDVRYGPRELLAAGRDAAGGSLGELLADGDIGALARSLSQRLANPAAPASPDRGAPLPALDPPTVARAWTQLAAALADAACDHRAPTLLIDALATTARVLRLPAVLADAGSPLTAWTCELPGLLEPAGWVSAPPTPTPAEAAEQAEDDDPPPTHPHASGPTREVLVQVRSSSLAFVAAEAGQEFRVDFTDGSSTVPLLATAFAERIIASRIGNATLRRAEDGTVWVTPRPELLFATHVDGRLLVRTAPDQPPSDVTHAIDWVVDLDWADLQVGADGVSFAGTLRASWIAPADDSPPAICVPDVGGFSRTVGLLHFTSEPTIEATTWSASVAGVIEADPLVATTSLARRALPLHVGYRGLLLPIGGLWTHGERDRIHLRCDRGEVTLLPSPGGRVLAAPGKGYRARLSGAARSLVGRG